MEGRAGSEYGLMQRTGGSEIAGELGVGNILNICIEVLGGTTSIDEGEEI